MKTKLLILVMILLPLVASADDVEVKNADGVTIYYSYKTDYYGKELDVTFRGIYYDSYSNEYTGNVVIPKSAVIYNGKVFNVTGISEGAFRDCSALTSVTIPNSVTSIGSSAFYYCPKLTSVALNSNAIVSENYTEDKNMKTIFGTQVTKFIIGDEVTSIGNWAFDGCSKLTSVTIPNSVTSIGDYAFRDCSKLTSVTIPNSVTSIGSGAFSYCKGLTSVTIPSSVTSIGSSAFSGCSKLTSVTIPNSVTSIRGYAFSGCSGLTSIIVALENTKYDSRSNCNAIIETASNTLVAGCKNTTIPNSVTSIRFGAFKGCSGLTSVTIPSSVTSIGDYAFDGCSGLTSVTIPNSVTSIGKDAFYGCSGLTSIVIPNSVTSIGKDAFYGCSGLTSVTIPNSVTSIGKDAFYGCSNLTSIALNSNAIVSKAYSSSSNIKNIIGTQVTEYIIGDEVTSIGDYAFSGCSGLTSVTIGNSVTSIGVSAFYGCSGLTSVTIGNSVTSIGEDAFYGTAWYNNQSDGLVYAGKVAYRYKGTMPANTVISILEGTLGIAGYAFYNCSRLTSVTIPNSVKSIGDRAFYGCSKLTSVTALNPNPIAITEDVFTNRTNATLYVPKGSKSAYLAADYWKEFKEIVEIDVTGIKAVENEQIAGSDETGNWYTLDGRRLSGKPTKRGIYIVNGRKVIVN